MNSTRRILIGALAGMVSVGVASASSIISFASNTVGPSITEVAYTLTLNKFDTTLGTLTGVRLVFKGAETSSVLLTNTSGGPVTFDVAANADLSKFSSAANSATAADKFTGQNLTMFDTGIGSALGSCSAGGTPAPGGCTPITLAGGASTTLGPVTVRNTDAAFGLPTATVAGVFGVVKTGTSIANYSGVGANTFTISGLTSNLITLASAGGNINADQNSTATFQAAVEYTYDVRSTTPEPATMALLGGGLVACGFLRRRSKKS